MGRCKLHTSAMGIAERKNLTSSLRDKGIRIRKKEKKKKKKKKKPKKKQKKKKKTKQETELAVWRLWRGSS